ncbi:MAG: ketopantoate reductase C-terminal domain-containing protein, partial [Elusimicrobiota bacterium]
ELVFVCLKACVIDAVMPDLKDLRAAGATIISYQNGLDTEGVIGEGIGDKKGVLRVVINYAGKLLDDGRVAVAFFHKPNYVGVLDPAAVPAAEKTAAAMSAAGLKAKYTDKISRQVWEKVILNSSMSPLSALTRLTMAEVMARPELVGVVEGLIHEGIEVAKSQGVDFENGFFEHCMGYLKKAGPHKPSMLVDVEAGRRTEIDFLNGMIRKQGAGKVEVPYHATITALIKGVEQSILTRRVNAASEDAQRQRPAGTLEEKKS